MGFAKNIGQYFFIATNVLLGLIGFGLIVIGIKHVDNENAYEHFLKNRVDVFFAGWLIVLIISGVLLFTNSYLAYFATYAENRMVMFGYIIIAMLVMILHLVVSIRMSSIQKDFTSNGKLKIEPALLDSMKRCSRNKKERDAWNTLQIEFSCCGINSNRDWASIANLPDLPGSCCGDVILKNCDSVNSFTLGCHDALVDEIKETIAIASGSGISVIIFAIFGIMLALTLIYLFKQGNQPHIPRYIQSAE